VVVSNENYVGNIYVADFFFTSCPTICPTMKAQMMRVYEQYEEAKDFMIVSHTIDPKYDTAALLKNYAQNLGVNTDVWQFLTGEKDSIYSLAEKSYMILADEEPSAPGGFIHSGAFLLVDKEQRIRGVYDGTVEEEVNLLINDIAILQKEYE